MNTRQLQTAEDLAQVLFLRFLHSHEAGKLKQNITYLDTIARNLCIDFYRTVQAVLSK